MRELGIHLTWHLIRDSTLLLCLPRLQVFFSCNYLMQPCKTTFSYSAAKYSFLDTFHKLNEDSRCLCCDWSIVIYHETSKQTTYHFSEIKRKGSLYFQWLSV